MRRFIWRGLAITLIAAGGCWTTYHVKGCPTCGAARLVRSIFGSRTPEMVAEGPHTRQPVVVDLSPAQLRNLEALLPESACKLEDFVTPEQRAKELELIDLSQLSAAANLARPSYEEEAYLLDLSRLENNGCLVDADTPPVQEPCQFCTGDVAPEMAAPTLIEANPKRLPYMPPCSDEPPPAPRFMAYATDPAPSAHGWLQIWMSLFRKPASPPIVEEEAEVIHLEEPPLCREDPALPYQYPGCPFISPSSPSTTPKARESKPKTDAVPDMEVQARPLKWHQTFKKTPEADENPAHPEVDTMEYRPSDAKKGAEDIFQLKRPY